MTSASVTDHPVKGRPTLVLVDRAWQSFEQFAAAVSRVGVHVVYIGVGLHGHSERVRSVAFPDSVFVPDLSTLPEILADVARRTEGGIDDVLCNELDLAVVLDAARAAGLPAAVIEQLEGRLPFADKVDASERLREWDLPTPRTCPVGTTPSEVAQQLGLPVVVKGRRGAGGLAVTFAADVAAIEDATADLAERTGDGVFFEEFLHGRNANYAGVHAHGRIVVDCCFDSVRSHGDVSRPPTGVAIVEEPEVQAIGRAMAARLPGVGIIDLEVMVTDDGRRAVIDTNLRPFGSLNALRHGGVDIAGAYAAALRDPGLDESTFPGQARSLGKPLAVFPTSSEILLQTGFLAGAREFVRSLPAALSDLGPRYVLLASLAFGTRGARRAVTDVRSAAGRARRG